MREHQKHAKLPRPFSGAYGRQEWAILGTPCGNIQRLAREVIDQLGRRWKTAYIDADHHAQEQSPEVKPSLEYTDQIHSQRLDFQGTLTPFQLRPLLNDQDLLLLNGNHFTAEKQILVIDPKKAESVQRKMDRLGDVRLILFSEGVEAIHPFLLEKFPHLASLPVLSLHDSAAVARFLENELSRAIPPLYGLVLAGGKSERMGRDKSTIDYHGLPQRDYVYNLLQEFCDETFLSLRPDQSEEGPLPVLPDVFLGLGPYGALLSAFQAYPDKAWLVAACDLPLLSAEALQFLTGNRDPSKPATAFISPENALPDPLLAIWEPKSYLTLLQFLAQGFSCPRKVLINSDTHLLQAPDPDWLLNVNTQEEYKRVMAAIGKAHNL